MGSALRGSWRLVVAAIGMMVAAGARARIGRQSLWRSILASGAMIAVGAQAEVGARAPNVLLIMCDQLNARVLGCYGGPVQTPNIDRIAREGVLFRNASCPWPVCSPSRATIVTGLYPHSHGITHNVMRRDYPAVPAPPTEEGIKVSDVTTEGILHAAGYSTHFYGKWHLLDDDLPYYTDMFTEHGAYAREMAPAFDAVRKTGRDSWMDWYGWALPVAIDSRYREALVAAESIWSARAPYLDFVKKMGRLEMPPSKSFDVRVADKVIDRIRSMGGGRFMITCSFNAPHDPNVAPSPYYEMFDPAAIALPANSDAREPRHEKSWSRQMVLGFGREGLREFLRVYYAMVRMIDDQVGRVLAALGESGQTDSTVIVFTADHGDMAGGHGMVWKSNSSFYEEIVRVPLLIRYPPLFRPQECDLEANLVDLMPTLLEMTGRPCPPTAQGQSLVPFLTGRKAVPEARRFAFCERVPPGKGNTRQRGARAGASFMVRGQGWKYIRYADAGEALYDLRNDPGETKNRIGEVACAPRKRAMADALEEWQGRTDWRQ